MSEIWKNTVLVVIDVQLGLFTGKKPIYKEDELLENINYLTSNARSANIPTIWIQHANESVLIVGTESYNIHPKLQPVKDDLFYYKTVSSTFEETDLHEVLQSKGIEKLVMTGTLTNACVKANCRAAKKLGYSVVLVKDAHSCWGNEKTGKEKVAHHNKKLVDDGIVTLKATQEIDFRQ
ncbi:MAG: isochorismatase family protein [Asgard group archaeon]|nr:isochorismatase family protein [Asgard group archaeon]